MARSVDLEEIFPSRLLQQIFSALCSCRKSEALLCATDIAKSRNAFSVGVIGKVRERPVDTLVVKAIDQVLTIMFRVFET